MALAVDRAAERVAPSPGLSGKFTFTSSASTFQTIRTATVGVKLSPVYVSIKTTADMHIVFGDANVGAPDNTFPLFQAGDGWQDFVLMPEMNGFRIKGDVGGGDFYWFVSSR